MKRAWLVALSLLVAGCGGGGGGGSSPLPTTNPTSQPSPPVASDDWTTYAHDLQRTGFETQSTGITSSTVSSLTLAWRNTPDPNCATQAIGAALIADEASPLVANGYVYYADECGYIAALSRDSGSVVWNTQLKITTPLAGPQGTPTLDAAHDLLIVPMHGTNGGQASGGYLVALNASTGAVVWQTTPLSLGNVRGEPLTLNGIVYEGLAGGDSDTGYVQGGLFAVSETTGQVVSNLPFFQVAPVGSSGDGGGAWSPITYDGQYLYFGTGNTKNNDGYQDSVVQMDPNTTVSSPNFSLKAFDGGPDEDVGGGEMLWGGNMYFEGKNGQFYGYALSNPNAPLVNAKVNTKGPQGSGAIWTPTTDGNVIAVSSGYNTVAPDQFSSTLDVFTIGSSSPRCALQATNSALYSYAAYIKGMAFVGIDNGISGVQNGAPDGSANGPAPEFIAFDDSCNILWQANPSQLLAYFYAGPVVVPSGVYAIDDMGNVYAWKLPSSSTTTASLRRTLVRPGVRSSIRRTLYARRETHL
jgi:hypothetical protein